MAKSPLLTRRQWLMAGAATLAGAGVAGTHVLHEDPTRLVHGIVQRIAIAAGKRPPNMVVYLADSLRADHLGCYGHGHAVSPRIDAFSRDSLVFDRCYSQSSWTKPSIASLFTGVLPRVHQAALSQWDLSQMDDLPVQVLRRNLITLAERLEELGYHGAYFASNPHVQREFGFARGFGYYEYHFAWESEKQADAVTRYIEQGPPEPFFLFIHAVDPHDPYIPERDTYRRIFGTTPEAAYRALPAADRRLLFPLVPRPGKNPDGCGEYRTQLAALSPEGRRFLARQYDAEIAGVDRQFGRILNTLDRNDDLRNNTAVAFISDHGEGFGEHGHFFHANSLFDEEIHVPLVLRLPGHRPKGRVPQPVALFDLYPTLVTLAGGEPPAYVQARSLLGRFGGVLAPEDRRVYSDLDDAQVDREQWASTMIIGPWKVLHRRRGGGEAVFNRDRDPRERVDFLRYDGPQRDEARRVARLFEQRQAVHMEIAGRFGEPEWRVPGTEHWEQLGTLGYL